MRILLIRPEDALMAGPWTGSKWDRIVDLGRGGISAYEEATSHFGCPVGSLDEFRRDYQEIRRARELLALGKNKLRDCFGLDWWALLAILVHQQIEATILLEDLAKTIAKDDEVWISAPGFHSQALREILGNEVRVFAARHRPKGALHYLETFRRLPFRQSIDIFWDKTDASYDFRRRLGRRPRAQRNDVVLLPTAYVNVSRTDAAYARSVPDLNFLLVATRRSGWLSHLPENVAAAWLSSYATDRSSERKAERKSLLLSWDGLHKELEDVPEFKIISRCDSFGVFQYYFAHGLGIRDAWLNVLDSEPVKAVLCADDSNPFTHIPVLLARERRIRTISCHHGALDGRCMVKECQADVVLAKGRMERDYLTRLCGVPPEKIVVGAPSLTVTERERSRTPGDRPFVVFFSEPYEATGGRATAVYADVLRPIAELAAREGRELIVKLHPSESVTERSRIVERLLSTDLRKIVRFVDEPLSPALLDKTWFGITVLSTVVVDCALHQVPCFLCKWLESSPYGYVDQFVRFGLGIPLIHPDGFSRILGHLRALESTTHGSEDFWEEASAGLLKEILCP